MMTRAGVGTYSAKQRRCPRHVSLLFGIFYVTLAEALQPLISWQSFASVETCEAFDEYFFVILNMFGLHLKNC